MKVKEMAGKNKTNRQKSFGHKEKNGKRQRAEIYSCFDFCLSFTSILFFVGRPAVVSGKENDIGWHKSWRETVRNQDLKEVERWEKLVVMFSLGFSPGLGFYWCKDVITNNPSPLTAQ